MKTFSSTVTSKGTITLPASFRHKANVKAGSKVIIAMQGNSFVVKPLSTWEDFVDIRDTINKNRAAAKTKPATNNEIEKAKIAYYKNKFDIK